MDDLQIKAIRAIRAKLRHGDFTRISEMSQSTPITRQYVSRVLDEKDPVFNEDVIALAEKLINDRENITKKVYDSVR